MEENNKNGIFISQEKMKIKQQKKLSKNYCI